MRKKTAFSIILLSALFFLAFGNVAKAQTPNYLGINEGDEYVWKANVNFEGVDTLIYNIRDIMVDQQGKLNEYELFGFEDLTINETIESIAHTYLTNILPSGWEDLNISTLIEETIDQYVESFNSTIFSGMIPSNWKSLNLSTFYDFMVDGINATMGIGWEDNPIPGLIELMVNELNSSILFGLVPEGWEDLTLDQLMLAMMEIFVPDMTESFVINRMLGEAMNLMFPSEYIGLSVENLLITIFDPLGLNASYLFEQIFFGLNSTLPHGMESEDMTVVIDFLIYQINSTLPEGYDSLTTSVLLDLLIDEFVYYYFPPEFHDLTLVEIISLGLGQYITLYNTNFIPMWEQFKIILQTSGLMSYEIGIKVEIINIGSVESLFLGGPTGVNIDLSIYYSLDFENWIDLSSLFVFPDGEDSVEVTVIFSMIPLLDFFTGSTMVLDPTSYSNVDIALMDQIMYCGGLFVANNYDWESIQTEMTIETTEDLNCIKALVEWNNNGVLSSASIDASGDRVASISLVGEEGEIPGFGIPIVLGFTAFSIIGIIVYIKRKNNL